MPGVRARLFDAKGHDRELPVEAIDPTKLGADQLAWVDIDLDAGGRLDAVAAALQLDDRERRRIEGSGSPARVAQAVDRIQLTLTELVPPVAGSTTTERAVEIDMIAIPNLVVTVHHGPSASIDRYATGLANDSSLGVLDAGELLSGLVDEVLNGYYELAEAIEREIDRLDQAALRGGPNDVLAGIVAVRRRISMIRRALVAHRAAFAVLARPEMRVEASVGRPWPGLVDRLEHAIGTFETLRESLIGTYDIHMGRVAQLANDVMKALTLLSAVLLPAVVLAGIMGMNFRLPFFDDAGNFFIVLAAMVAFAGLLLGFGRWRHWL